MKIDINSIANQTYWVDLQIWGDKSHLKWVSKICLAIGLSNFPKSSEPLWSEFHVLRMQYHRICRGNLVVALGGWRWKAADGLPTIVQPTSIRETSSNWQPLAVARAHVHWMHEALLLILHNGQCYELVWQCIGGGQKKMHWEIVWTFCKNDSTDGNIFEWFAIFSRFCLILNFSIIFYTFQKLMLDLIVSLRRYLSFENFQNIHSKIQWVVK